MADSITDEHDVYTSSSALKLNCTIESQGGDVMRLISLSLWFIAFATMALVSMPPQSHSGDREDKLAASCGITATAGGGPAVFAAAGCFGKGLFMQEVETCLTGGECLGDSNDLVGCNGWLMRKFGALAAMVQGPDSLHL